MTSIISDVAVRGSLSGARGALAPPPTPLEIFLNFCKQKEKLKCE